MRFPGFTEEWETKKLGELSEKIGDGLHGTPMYVDESEYYFINGNNLVNGKIEINENTKKIDIQTFVKNDKGLKKNSLLISINGTIGNIAKYDNEKVMLGKSVAYYNFYKNSDFFYFALQTRLIQDFFNSELTGSTIKNLSLRTLRETYVSVPLDTEQNKISCFLTLLDKRITTQNKIIKELIVLKTTLAKRIFLQDLTFKDDKRDKFQKWQIKKLQDVCDVCGGGTPETDKAEYWNGNIQWFTPTEIKSNYISRSERTISELGLKNSSAKLLPKGTILLTTRATIGEVSIALEECTTNQGFQSLITKKDCNNIFLFNWLKINKYKLVKRANGSTFSEISKSEIEKIEIVFPSIEEQTKIADFLSSIDSKIDIEKQLLKKLEVQKKFLLKQMFV